MREQPKKHISEQNKPWNQRLLGFFLQTDNCRCGEVTAGKNKDCSCSCNNICATREWTIEKNDVEKPDGPTLNNLPSGERARVEQLCLPPALKKRLLSMGLTNGTEMAVINNQGGRMIIAVRDSRLGLSPAMASKITYKPI